MIHEHKRYTAECDICHKIDQNHRTKESAQQFLDKYHNDNCPNNPKAKRCKTCTVKYPTEISEYFYGCYEYYYDSYYCIHGEDSDSCYKPMISHHNSCPHWSDKEQDKYQYDEYDVQDIIRNYEVENLECYQE